MKVGITGQAGFVGTHLYNHLGLKNDIVRIPFEDNYFENKKQLKQFVGSCDVIIHLAAINRHDDPLVIYNTNISLVKKLIEAMEAERVTPHVLFSSSTQEEKDNPYGKSKKEGRELLEQWAIRNNAAFTGLVIPNVYGPFGRPYYNSFVATFCHQLTHNEQPKIDVDGCVKLIYVGSLCEYIISCLSNRCCDNKKVINNIVPHDFESKVSEIMAKLEVYKRQYFKNGIIPVLEDKNDINLFNSLRCYIDHANHFPVKLVQHADTRGVFVETVKLGVGGQVSFSTTVPGITRGNHYHTRKIERFTVIKGKALIQLRKVGTDDVMSFYLNGNEPSYVDMPIWYTHNITNIGEDELYTQFWINEWYNAEDDDTFFEVV